MLCAMFVFAAGDAIAKLLTNSFHPVQIIWFRQAGLFIGVCVWLAIKGVSILHTKQPRLQVTRGVLVIGSSLLFVYAVRHAPLADAVAASFVAPFFLTIFGAAILKETVGLRRWVAVVVGFIGALVVIRPGMGVIHPAVMLVVLAAILFAARQVIGRILSTTDNTITTIAFTAIVSTIVITLPLPFVWESPQHMSQWLLLLGMAVSGALGEILIIRSLEVAEAAVIAPIHYTILIWATVYGYLVFGQFPDQWTFLGTAIIVAAGLYTIRRSSAKVNTPHAAE